MGLLSHLKKHYKIIVTVAVTILAILCRKYISFFSLIEEQPLEKPIQIFSHDQLKKFNGLFDEKLYLAVIGTVFNVTEKAAYYGKGAPYHYFVGKDGSRGFATGNFTDESGGKDHILDLSCGEIITIIDWHKTFREKYPSIGLLAGRYYDKYGRRTDYMRLVKKMLQKCREEKERIRKEELTYPPCNISWNQDDGARVWCTISSGGVIRNWVGVPRQLYTPGEEKPRCVCVKHGGAKNRLLKPYDGCADTSQECLVKENKT